MQEPYPIEPSRRSRSVLVLVFVLALALALALLLGCGDPAGTPCMISGSGFTARHDCRHRCLSRWELTCPDGERITPGQCTGAFDCQPGTCPNGQVCYHDDDPFDDRSFCVVASTCGPMSPEALAQWEFDRVAAQEEMRTRRREKEARKAKWQAENPDAKHSAPAENP